MKNGTFNQTVLVVDDNKNTLEIITRNLKNCKYKVIGVSSVKNAIEALGQNEIGLLITDNKMPQTTGMQLIKYVRDHYPNLGIIMITGYASIDGAVDAIKVGADEYISKPFTDTDLIEAVTKTIKKKYVENNVTNASLDIEKWQNLGLIGSSSQLQKIFGLIERACLNEATVLITGESGTGKELIARAIHYLHKERATQPFVAVNCPGIPETLFESELFGHVRGAFTGANESKDGFFYSARKGTIFLDEISELNLQMQAKLLRTLQEKTICKIGSSQNVPIDVRIIAASNKKLEELIEKEKFREDLYYRLNVLNIHLPSLSERNEDIPTLAKFFAEKYSKQFNQKTPRFSDSAMESLINYKWPGNIRELENIIQRCLIVNDKDVIDTSDFPDKLKCNLRFPSSKKKSLREVEREHVLLVLESVGGNKTKAADILGIDRKTLRDKL